VSALLKRLAILDINYISEGMPILPIVRRWMDDMRHDTFSARCLVAPRIRRKKKKKKKKKERSSQPPPHPSNTTHTTTKPRDIIPRQR
jgi:hypothetical protein